MSTCGIEIEMMCVTVVLMNQEKASMRHEANCLSSSSTWQHLAAASKYFAWHKEWY